MSFKASNYFTYFELQGIHPTLDDLHTDLKKFRRKEVVYICSVINSVLQDWQGKCDRKAHDDLIKESLPVPLAAYVLAGVNDAHNPRSLYHRQQLLLVCKEALQYCGETGLNPLELPQWGGLGMVLLKASDLLPKRLSRHHGAVSQILNVVSEMIPVAEASGFYSPAHKFVRSYAMLTRFLGRRELDVPQIFESATGMPLHIFQALSYATISRYAEFTVDNYRNNPESFLISADWFRHITLPNRVTDKFLRDISADADELKSCLQQKNHAINDFGCFREKPLFRDGEIFFVLNNAFLAEKADTGPFWRVLNALSTSREKNLFHVIWGDAFEKYINWLIAESASGELNKHFPNPQFAFTNEEVCDAIVICGEAAIFIESKGSTFTAASKYGTNLNILENEIEDKLVLKKGVGQLANKIERVFNRKRPESVEGVDLSRITKVFPVLITRDDIGSGPAMNMYLNHRFKDLFNRKAVSRTITPLFSLSAQDVEKLCGYLQEATLADLLEARYQNEPVLKSSFWLVSNPVASRIGKRECQAFAGVLREFVSMVENELFKKSEWVARQ